MGCGMTVFYVYVAPKYDITACQYYWHFVYFSSQKKSLEEVNCRGLLAFFQYLFFCATLQSLKYLFRMHWGAILHMLSKVAVQIALLCIFWVFFGRPSLDRFAACRIMVTVAMQLKMSESIKFYQLWNF